MRILVCGSRTFSDYRIIEAVLTGFWTTSTTMELILIEGEATGADTLAAEWATAAYVNVERYPANWELHGKAAGPIRNQEMLDSGVDICFAFVDKPLAVSRGTADMVNRCRNAGVKTYVIEAL